MKRIEGFEYWIGDIVYLKTDTEQLKRIVYSITISEGGILYLVTQGTDNSNHYGFEMSSEKDNNISMGL